jgi:hypothetical protein
MIPKKPDQIYRHKDEKSGITYLFRYLLGAQQEEFLRLTGEFQGTTEKELKKDPARSLGYCRQLIDLFLIGWEGGKDLPKFPADGKPSDLFNFNDATEMGKLITELVPELTGVSVGEAKN